MNIRIGCDLVCMQRFATSFKQPGFLQKVFTTHELALTDQIQKFAGMFAIKESVAKALGMVPPPWQHIEIFYQQGRPCVRLLDLLDGEHTIDVSVAHDGDYVMAQALVYGVVPSVHSERVDLF